MSASTHILTIEEALALPEDRLEEIVNGEIRRIPPPEKGHFRLVAMLARLLLKQLSEDRFEVVTTAYGLGVRKEPTLAVRTPDLTIFDAEELNRDHDESKGRGYVWIAPKLIVECLSPSNRKGSIHQLLADYESARASEVWLINPRKRIITTHFLQDGELGQQDSLSQGLIKSAGLPVEVEIDRLWSAFETGR